MKNEITAVVLAGGKGSRINRDKTLLKVGNLLLLEKTTALLKEMFAEVIIVVAGDFVRKNFTDYKIVTDEFQNCGPLAGIHIALKNAAEKAIFVFACDMPNLNSEIIQRQLLTFENSRFDAIVPKHNEGIEPLHAIYAKSCLPAIEKNLKQKNYSVRSFFREIKVGYLEFGISEIKYFFNINTEHDLKHIQKIRL